MACLPCSHAPASCPISSTHEIHEQHHLKIRGLFSQANLTLALALPPEFQLILAEQEGTIILPPAPLASGLRRMLREFAIPWCQATIWMNCLGECLAEVW